MNEKQERAIERLREAILANDGHHSSDYEYKRFEATESDYPGSRLVFLYTVVGRKNDEGTYGELFARTARHIAIGPRGGLHLLNAKRKTESHGWRAAWAQTA